MCVLHAILMVCFLEQTLYLLEYKFLYRRIETLQHDK
jgi:hypothetical protein